MKLWKSNKIEHENIYHTQLEFEIDLGRIINYTRSYQQIGKDKLNETIKFAEEYEHLNTARLCQTTQMDWTSSSHER